MKKRHLIIPLISIILVGCISNKPSSSSSEIGTYTFSADMLTKLAQGYRLDLSIKQTLNNQVSMTFDEVGNKGEQYFHKMFLEETKEEAKIFETYSKNEEGFLLAERRDINNTKHFSKVYNPATSEYYKWTDGYENAFKFVSVSDFELKEDNTYALKVDTLDESAKTNFATQLYGNPGLELTKFEVSINQESITSIYAECSFETMQSTYAYEINGSLVSQGEDVIIEERAKPFEEVQDNTFEKMISTLKNYNYTLNYTGLDSSNNILEATYLTTNEGVYYELGDEFEKISDGYLVVKDNMLQNVTNVNGSFVKVGEPEEADISELRPSMNLSRACFDLKDNKYVLKADIDADLDVIYNLETLSTSLDEFTIEIKEDSYVFTNTTYNNLKEIKTIETVTFTKLGTTVLPFDENSLGEQISSSAWSELINPIDTEVTYEQLEAEFGELMLVLPLVENHTALESWAVSCEDNVYMLMSQTKRNDENFASDVEAYVSALSELGFEENKEVKGFEADIVYSLTDTFDGVEKTVNIELVNYYGYLVIILYFAE